MSYSYSSVNVSDNKDMCICNSIHIAKFPRSQFEFFHKQTLKPAQLVDLRGDPRKAFSRQERRGDSQSYMVQQVNALGSCWGSQGIGAGCPHTVELL